MPNPGNGSTVLKSSVNMEIKVMNELGQVVRSLSLSERNGRSEQLDDLKEGIYFVTLIQVAILHSRSW